MSHQLFQPIHVGRMELNHRVVVAPLTRSRAAADRVVGDLIKAHYGMRATVPGTLIISEATFTTPRDTGLPFYLQAPGIWDAAQIAGWKEAVDVVHARGSYIYNQLWSPGRLNSPELLASIDPSFPYISAGTTIVSGWSRAPEPITQDDVKNFVSYFANAAAAAVHEAGFDGVEISAMYFLEEFLKDISNNRMDEYGFQTPENAARFCLEVVDAVVARVGQDRVGLKVNPWTRLTVFDGGVKQSDPRPVYTYFINEVRNRHPNLSYLHVTEPRIEGSDDKVAGAGESNDFLRDIWRGKPYLADGGYKRDSAIIQADKNESELIVFGRMYTSNPDLPIRLEHNIPLTPYDRSTFYTDGAVEGYNTFKFANESKKILARQNIDVSHV